MHIECNDVMFFGSEVCALVCNSLVGKCLLICKTAERQIYIGQGLIVSILIPDKHPDRPPDKPSDKLSYKSPTPPDPTLPHDKPSDKTPDKLPCKLSIKATGLKDPVACIGPRHGGGYSQPELSFWPSEVSEVSLYWKEVNSFYYTLVFSKDAPIIYSTFWMSVLVD